MQMKNREEKRLRKCDEAVNTIEDGRSDWLIDESGFRERREAIPRLPGVRFC